MHVSVPSCQDSRCSCGVSQKAKQHSFFFLSTDLSSRPWGVCPKDALGPTEGAVVPHSPLWWTTLLVWGTSLCLQRLSVCARCRCAVSWKNSAIKMLRGIKRKIFGRVHYQVTFGGQVHPCCSCRCCNHMAEMSEFLSWLCRFGPWRRTLQLC